MKAIIYRIGRFILAPFVHILYRPTIIGKENIQKNTPAILAGTHTSYYDAFIIGVSTKEDLHYIVKKELHDGKFGFIFKYAGTIAVDRKRKSNTEAVSEAVNLLKNNKKIVIFPEGTINKSNEDLLPFKHGAVRMSSESGAKIIPFAITGKFKLFKKSIIINIGKPYNVSGNIEEDNKILENKVRDLLKEIKNEKKRRT